MSEHLQDPNASLSAGPRLWQRVREVFSDVVELSGEARAARLAEADPAVRREVQELLDADERADSFLEVRQPAPSGGLQGGNAIGPYTIERELGRGGMGVVYLAQDRELQRPVAIKCLSGELAGTTALERLEREARILASLSHPNVATIYSLEKDGGELFLVLEYVPGVDLSERLAAERLSLRESLRVAVQVAAALEAAHERGVVHRDLKPGNVRITSDGSKAPGRVKVLDFGLAKPLTPGPERSEHELTRSGTILGTVSYMSPEQAEGRELDRRSDIFSFGTLLFECLAGERPFQGPNPWRTLDAIVREPPDWSLLPPDLPRALVRLLQRCLRKDPGERLRDAGDIRLELSDLLAELSSAELPAFVPERPGRRRTFPARIAAAAVAVLFFAGGFFLGRRGEPPVAVRQPIHLSVALHPVELRSGGGMPVLALSPDGRRLAYSSLDSLYLRPLDGFESRRLVADVRVRAPFFSPDSRQLAYFADHLYVMDIDAGVPTVLFEGGGQGVGASWGDSGSIVFAADWQSGLSRITPSGGAPEVLTRLDQERHESSHRWPQLLPGERGVLFTVKTTDILSFDDASIAVLDLRTGEQRTLIEKATAPLYAPTGEAAGHLLYSRGGDLHAVPFDVEALAIVGSPAIVLEDVDVDPTTGAAAVFVARDGTLAYLPPQERPACAVVRIHPSGEVTPLPVEKRFYTRLSLSPDGRRLAIKVIAANNTLWVSEIERGTLQRVSGDLGNVDHPVWHPDGEHLTFLATLWGEKRLVTARADGSGEPRVVLEDASLLRPAAVTRGGALIYERWGEASPDIWIHEPSGESRPLLATRFREGNTELSPDGRWLAYTSDETGIQEVFIRAFPELSPKMQVSVGGVRLRILWSTDSREIHFEDLSKTRLAVRVFGPPDLRVGTPRVVFEEQPERRYIGWIAEKNDAGGQTFLAIDCPSPPPDPESLRIILNFFDLLRSRLPEER